VCRGWNNGRYPEPELSELLVFRHIVNCMRSMVWWFRPGLVIRELGKLINECCLRITQQYISLLALSVCFNCVLLAHALLCLSVKNNLLVPNCSLKSISSGGFRTPISSDSWATPWTTTSYCSCTSSWRRGAWRTTCSEVSVYIFNSEARYFFPNDDSIRSRNVSLFMSAQHSLRQLHLQQRTLQTLVLHLRLQIVFIKYCMWSTIARVRSAIQLTSISWRMSASAKLHAGPVR
jgi:hypothetical protein